MRVILAGAVGAYHSDELYFTCLSALERGSAVDVDCSATTHLGGSTVQMLVALARAVAAPGRALRLVAVPAALGALLRAAGLTDLLPSGAT